MRLIAKSKDESCEDNRKKELEIFEAPHNLAVLPKLMLVSVSAPRGIATFVVPIAVVICVTSQFLANQSHPKKCFLL